MVPNSVIVFKKEDVLFMTRTFEKANLPLLNSVKSKTAH